MNKILILLNHQLTDVQVAELRGKGFEPEYMSVEEKATWSQIKPECLKEMVESILLAHPTCKAAVVQGHFGAVGHVLRTYGFKNCYYAHQVRPEKVDVVNPEGEMRKVMPFVHVAFYSYEA